MKSTNYIKKTSNFFLLNFKKIALIIFLEIGTIILHNLVYGISGLEDAFFFILAVFVIPIYFISAVTWTTINLIIKLISSFQKRKNN